MVASHQDDEEKPLDPAVERVRRRLLRFMVINLALLFVVFLVVLGAIFYKMSTSTSKRTADAGTARQVPTAGEIAGEIALPAGARIVGQSLSGNRALLTVEEADGSRTMLLYDLEAARTVGRYGITPQ